MSAAVAIAVLGVGSGVLHSVPSVANTPFVLAGLSVGALDVMVNVEGAAVEQALGRTVMPLMHGAWSAGIAVGSGIGAACAAGDIAPSVQFAGQALLLVVVGTLLARSIPTHTATTTSTSTPKEPAPQRVRQWAGDGPTRACCSSGSSCSG